MRIKKHPSGNQYLYSDGVWVRNFLAPVTPLDINTLSAKTDYPIFFENEVKNEKNNVLTIESNFKASHAVIVSDGYKFQEKQELLTKLPNHVAIIATNRTLVKWAVNRKINFFLVNNPYAECMNFMPSHRYYPKCIASTKTYPGFTEEYKERGGVVLNYSPTPEQRYHSPCKAIQLDDYRNPICASISLAYKLGVTRLMLFCCDDSFDTERPGAMQLENGLWMYPQHLMVYNIIEGMFHWYQKIKGAKLGNFSSGVNYSNAPYIHEEEVCNFFSKIG